MTRVLPVDPQSPNPATITEAAARLREGGLVAFPTETVYGLGANALDADAVERIFVAKERDRSDPLIVHITGADSLPIVAGEVPPLARKLADACWPGPLTLVLPRSAAIPPIVTAGGETVAVRVPAHPVARALIEAAGVPVAAPSANRFMRTSATTAAHVLDDLEGRIDIILDGGPASAGIESTVVRVDDDRVTVLRPGAVSVERLRAVAGDRVDVAQRAASTAESPGQLERHYAPRARLVYLPDASIEDIATRARSEAATGARVGLLLATGDLPGIESEGFVVERPGPVDDLDAVAAGLFASLRRLDAAEVDVIMARDFPRDGAGLAIHDRLRRASYR